VASTSRLLKIIGLFCKRALWKRRYSAKENYNFIDPTDGSHPIFAIVIEWLWPRPIRCLKLQIMFCKRVTNYRALLRKMTCEEKASCESWPPCMALNDHDVDISGYSDYGVDFWDFCSVLQCVAVCCSVLQCVAVWLWSWLLRLLQCAAVCCSVLQCAAVRCSVTMELTFDYGVDFWDYLPAEWASILLVFGSVLLRVEVCCSVLQCVAVCWLLRVKSAHSSFSHDSFQNATSPKSTRSRNANLSVQIHIKPKPQCEFVPRDTEESEFLDLVDSRDVAFSVESVKHQRTM